ncbi:MFS transporter [Planctomycetota bacterium]
MIGNSVNKRIISVAVAVGINTLAYSIIYPFLPIYLHSVRKIPMHIVGLVFPAMGLAAIIGAPLAGNPADRIGRRKLLVGGPIGRSACFFGLAGMAHINASFWAFVIMLFMAAVSHLAPKDRVGRYMGAFGLVQGLGWASWGPIWDLCCSNHCVNSRFCCGVFSVQGPLLPPSVLPWRD